jgi:hypothetical protein
MKSALSLGGEVLDDGDLQSRPRRPGTAAQAASARVQTAGWKVAAIDNRPFGGTCALRGCDPKKVLISGANDETASDLRAVGQPDAYIVPPLLHGFHRRPEADLCSIADAVV